MSKQKILIVDDDNNIAELISLYLTKECYDTKIVNDGEEALHAFEHYNPNLILLDLMLPGIDGYQVCREIRTKSNVPIIMLSAKGEIFDKVLGLELGADDYILKPFDSKELVARVKAVLRRFQPAKTESVVELKCVEYPDLTVNLSNYSVMYNGHPIDMPPKELELLYFLAASPNQVFTREQLLDHIWGYEYIGDTRTVDVHVKRLREKIKDHETWSIATVWGIGYKFEVKDEKTLIPKLILAMSCLWLSALSSCVRSHSMRSRIMPKTGRHSSYTGNLYRLHLVMLTIIINTVFRCRIFKSRCKVLANIFLPKSGSWTIREIFFLILPMNPSAKMQQMPIIKRSKVSTLPTLATVII